MRISKPPEERRAELVAAARALFDEKGVEKTRISDIVRRVGVAQGVFYYYFRSKEEMVREVSSQVACELDTSAGAIMNDTGADFYKKLAGFIELYLDLVDKFTGDDETSLPRQPAGEEGFLPDLVHRLTAHLKTLVEAGAAQGLVTAEYPWQATQVLLHGLRTLAETRIPTRREIYALTEQGLGLVKGALTAHLPGG